MKNNIIFIFCLLVFAVTTHAQKGYELGGWVGTSMYYGDLNPNVNIKKPGIALGFTAKRNFNSRISLRGSISYANVSGADSLSNNTFQKNRNLSFKSTLWDITGGVEFNFFPLEHTSYENLHTPFVMAGVNLFKYSPKATLNGIRYNLREFTTEGQQKPYLPVSAGFVLGGGYKWAFGNNWYVAVEGSMRFLFTDYLDDVSSVYPNFDDLAANKGDVAVQLSDRTLMDGIAVEGRQRGDTKSNDRYVFVGISVMKFFGVLECPPISRLK